MANFTIVFPGGGMFGVRPRGGLGGMTGVAGGLGAIP